MPEKSLTNSLELRTAGEEFMASAQEREQEEPRSKRREEKERREGRNEKDSDSGWFACLWQFGGTSPIFGVVLLKGLRMYCRSAEQTTFFSIDM